MTPLSLPLALGAGYLLGSIPSGTIVARLYRDVDLTRTGSRRTGATNVLRTLGPGAAAIVFVGDALKGAVAAGIGFGVAGGSPWGGALGALSAVLGHTYSPFIGFRGGRGVVTGLAATFVADPQAIGLAVGAGSLCILGTRYVSLGSIVGAVVGGLLLVRRGVASGEPAWIAWGVLVGGMIVVSHRDNIQRLLAGTERKVGQPPSSAGTVEPEPERAVVEGPRDARGERTPGRASSAPSGPRN